MKTISAWRRLKSKALLNDERPSSTVFEVFNSGADKDKNTGQTAQLGEFSAAARPLGKGGPRQDAA
jgi:hypothetical protein